MKRHMCAAAALLVAPFAFILVLAIAPGVTPVLAATALPRLPARRA